MSEKITSKYPGVSYHLGKWIANTYKDKKQIYLGIFNTEEEANQAILNAKSTGDYSIKSGYKEKATSKYRNIAKVGKRFMVSKTFNHKQYYIGTYETEEIALEVLSLVNSIDDIPKYRHYKK